MILSVCVLWSMTDADAVLTLRTGSHNGTPPFPRTNGRQIASNSKGFWFVAHDGAAAGVPAIHLTVSKGADPEISGDFHRSVEVAGGSGQSVLSSPFRGARAASLLIDWDDVLHLVFQSSEPEGIWYAQCPVADEKPSESLGTRTNWTRSDGRTTGGDPVSHEAATRAPPLSHFHTVGRGGGRHAGTLGMALATRGPDGGVYFDTLKVPGLKPAPGRRVLFPDMQEVSGLEGLKRSFQPMR